MKTLRYYVVTLKIAEVQGPLTKEYESFAIWNKACGNRILGDEPMLLTFEVEA